MKHLLFSALLFIGLNAFTQDSTLLKNVLSQLNLKVTKCKLDLVATKTRPNNPEETIMVIPEIVAEDEHYFELNSHILIVDSKTGEIKSRFFESSVTNGWYSDAVKLVEISIDTAPYNVKSDTRAFGVKVRYLGSSQANPYAKETISLFVEHEDGLKQILKNFSVQEYHGEWDTNCAGEFTEVTKILTMSKKVSNGYADIIVKTTTSNSIAFVNENDACDEKETISKKSEVLTFENGGYK